MNILAIETATTACAAGVSDGTSTLTRVLDNDRHHTEALTSGIGELLSDIGLSLHELDRVVVDRGPGLYTGLRVGIATAQALASGLGIELVGITSLEVLADEAWQSGVRGRLCCLVDARRGEVFVQTFELAENVRAINEPQVARAGDLAVVWATSGDPITVTGDGVERYRATLEVVANVSFFEQLVPSVASALLLAANRDPASHVAPLYLREADAVANFTTRERPA